jgi:hypothetical protein
MTLLPAILALATTVTPHLGAARASKAPVLDGRLDDAVWKTAEASETFTQKIPESGKAASERTIVRVVYDNDNVYVGIDCPQKAEVVGRLTRRDRNVEADSVEIALDSRGDGKTAFGFSINASGTISDGLHFNDTDYSQDWDENWEGQAARTPTGWSAELRIPLRILRFGSRPVQSWGFQVKRYVSALQELDEWAYIPRDSAGEVSHYGRLDNLVALRPGATFELRPFVAGGVRHHDPQATALARGFQPSFSAGLDLKWHISQELTLDATVLPDFGQVEADQVVLNLTTFEQYYPEKRPFFLEGADTFNTPFQLLYTRRIGRAPYTPALPSDGPIIETAVHDPGPSTIYGAAKLVGDLGHHLSVGELFALTGKQTVEVQPFDISRGSPFLPALGERLAGRRIERLADPLTSYKVLRIKREIGDNSHVGLIAMATNRLESGAEYPVVPSDTRGRRTDQLCPSGDQVAPGQRCFHDAYVGGVDARWRSPSGDYSASGQVIGTVIQNGPTRTLLDGTVVRPGDVGPAVQARLAKDGGKHWSGNVLYQMHGRQTDYNDLGYMQRQNEHRGDVNLQFHTLDPVGPTLETRTSLLFRERDNLDGLNLGRGFALTNFTRFSNFWGTYSEIHYFAPHFDDREMGDGAALQRTGIFGFEIYVFTDSRKSVDAEVWTQTHFLQNGGFGFQGDGRVSVRVLPQWDIDLLPSWLYVTGEPRFIGTQNGSYVFGLQRAQSLGLTLRSTYNFTPALTLQAYGQLFLESQHYTGFSTSPEAGKGAIARLDELQPLGAAPGSPVAGDRAGLAHPRGPLSWNPDFQGGTFNANLVLRWEYRLGSTLYVVYTHSQNRAATPHLGDATGFDFHLIRPGLAEDAVLTKLSYWWG